MNQLTHVPTPGRQKAQHTRELARCDGKLDSRIFLHRNSLFRHSGCNPLRSQRIDASDDAVLSPRGAHADRRVDHCSMRAQRRAGPTCLRSLQGWVISTPREADPSKRALAMYRSRGCSG